MRTSEAPLWTRPQSVWAKRGTLMLLVRRDLKVRYADSALGYVWSVLDPLLMGLIYWFVFTIIFPRGVGNQPYMVFLLSALLPWQWFTSGITEGSQALTKDGALVRSTSLPREIWVARVVLSKGIEFLFSVPVLAVFVLYYLVSGHRAHMSLNHHLIYFPVAIVLQAVLLAGMAMILSPLVVLLKDVEPLIRVWLRWMFYASPVLYGIQDVYKSSMPEWLHLAYLFNPMTGILSLYRAGFFPGSLHRDAVLIAAAMCPLILIIGQFVFARFEATVLKEL